MVSEKMIYEGSLNFKARELDTMLVCKTNSPTDMENNMSAREMSSRDRLETSDQNGNSSREKGTSDGKDQIVCQSKDMENNVSSRATSDSKDRLETSDQNSNSSREKGTTHRCQAALKLQKVYKSFRTRRQLADCAILVEQRWYVTTEHSFYKFKLFAHKLYYGTRANNLSICVAQFIKIEYWK